MYRITLLSDASGEQSDIAALSVLSHRVDLYPLATSAKRFETAHHDVVMIDARRKLIEARNTGTPFTITGVDWPTRDGSGIRDYIHVWDLAAAHVAAIEKFDSVVSDNDYLAINLGTGTGTTVFELVEAFDAVTGEKLATTTGPARPGDAAGAYTRSSRAKELLGWVPKHDIKDGIADTLKWFEVRENILDGF